MVKRVALAGVVCQLCALLFTGCTNTLREIPTGEWRGRGAFVDYEASFRKGGARQPRTRTNTRSYDTFLKITKTRAYGRDTVVLSIRSDRGPLFNVPFDRTEGEVGLVEMAMLPGGVVLYAVLSSDDLHEGYADDAALPEDTVAFATLIPVDQGVVLQVGYDRLASDMCFIDTYTFAHGQVSKTGNARFEKTSNGEKYIEVFWAEEFKLVGTTGELGPFPGSDPQWQAYVAAEEEAYRFASEVLKRDPDDFVKDVHLGGMIYHDRDLEVNDGKFVAKGSSDAGRQVVMVDQAHHSLLVGVPLEGPPSGTYGFQVRFGYINHAGTQRVFLSKGSLGVLYERETGRWTRQYVDIIDLANDRAFDAGNIRARGKTETPEQEIARYLKLARELESRYPGGG